LRHWHQLDRNVENAARGLICRFGIRPSGPNLSDSKEANRGDALLKSTGVASEKLSAFLGPKKSRLNPGSENHAIIDQSHDVVKCISHLRKVTRVNGVIARLRMVRKNFLIVSLKLIFKG
jgi:hypothetical protein